LLKGIRQVIKNQIFVSPGITKRLQQRQSNNEPYEKDSIIVKLSDRELQVFDLIGNGMKTKDIADNLKLSIKTIETHRRHIKDKLSLTSGTELVRAAIMWTLENQ
jgi:DNA-binding NarL/FixJ family response regulator